MNRTERLYRIDQLLRNRRLVKRADLLAELEVSSATLTRDIEHLRSQLHAPIVFDADRGAYRLDLDTAQTGPSYALPGLWFNESELHALLAIEHLLESMQPGLLAPHVAPLRARMAALLGEGRYSAEVIRQRIFLERATPRRVVTGHFETCATATLARKRLLLAHFDRHSATVNEREVSPQRLVRYKENWYLDTWCHVRQAVRTFSVDALRSVTLLDSVAMDVPETELQAILGAGYGIYAGKDVRWATLRFSPYQARWTASEVWHPEQCSRWDPDGHYVLEIPHSAPSELLMDILKYGAEVEVIAPEDLRAEVARRLHKAADLYG